VQMVPWPMGTWLQLLADSKLAQKYEESFQV